MHHACQLLRLNFKDKSDYFIILFIYYFIYDFSLKLSTITRLYSDRVSLNERKLSNLFMNLIFQCVKPVNFGMQNSNATSKSMKSRAAH